MEHSKGNLTAQKDFDMEGMRHIFIRTEKGYLFGRIDGHEDGLCCGKPDISMDEAKANAERLVTCWNEHDTLKAKAELFDELITFCESYDGGRIKEITVELLVLLDTFIDKAKDLK